MDSPSPLARTWAQRLLALEAANPSASELDIHAAGRVSDKLRISLTRFVGTDGFVALQRRALALARRQIPSLQNVRVNAEGRLEGLEAADENGEAATAITAHVLALLVTLMGEPLTLRLIRDAFPDAPPGIIGESEDL